MANVLHSHAPSAFGFGFGLSQPPATIMKPSVWQPSQSASQSSGFYPVSSGILQASPSRVQKRRHEPDENEDSSRYARDEAMDRSPTPPERPKKAAPKRARVVTEEPSKDEKNSKDRTSASDDNDVDVGVLLGMLLCTPFCSLFLFCRFQPVCLLNLCCHF